MSRPLALLALFAASMLGGCAITTERIEVPYSPAPGAVALPGAAAVAVAVRVNDAREDKGRIGTKRNAYGLAMAPILAGEEVPITVRRALEAELRARGFQGPGPTVAVLVDVDLDRFMSDFKVWTVSVDATAQVTLRVTVPGAGGRAGYSRRIAAEGVKTGLPLMTAERAREVLTLALADAVGQLFADPAFAAALLAAARGESRAGL